ncbi:hypothetical protein CANINC_004211 [Pichia inconspicua]|uniref:Uncharacterized protein n=1 Tax=Pichia inconspicua TaxID=52247 RepID=A0A4T0WWQ9_9ASCO|nr:hypothetical protein CANINC_004211 [[Candida] inconspicua]
MIIFDVLHYLKIFIVGYILLHLITNFSLRGKASIGLISWFQVFFIKLRLKEVSISICSISIQIRPLYFFNRSQLKALHNDGFIIVHVRKIVIDTERMVENSSIVKEKNQVKVKTNAKKIPLLLFNLLNKINLVLPVTFVLHNIVIKNKEKFLEIDAVSFSLNSHSFLDANGMKGSDNALSLTISDVRTASTNLLVYTKLSLYFILKKADLDQIIVPKLAASLITYGINVDVENLKDLLNQILGKKVKAEKPEKTVDIDLQNIFDLSLEEKWDNLFKHFQDVSTYLAFADTRIKSKDHTISVKNLSYTINTIEKDKSLNCRCVSDLMKHTLSLNSLDAKSDLMQDSGIHLEFINHVTVMSVPSIIQCFKNIRDIEYIEKLVDEQAFLAKNFCTISNITINLDLKDILSLKKNKKPKNHTSQSLKSAKIVLFENLLRLTNNIPIRAQIIATTFRLHLADNVYFTFSIDDALLDSANPDNIGLLFETEYYSAAKSICTIFRNMQAHIEDHHHVTKFFSIDMIDSSCSIFVGANTLRITDVSCHINTIDLLLDDISLIKKISTIANDVVNRENRFSVVKDDISNGEEIDSINTSNELYVIAEGTEESTENLNSTQSQAKKKSILSNIFEVVHFDIAAIKFVTCFENPVKYWDGEDQSFINKFKRGFAINLSGFSYVYDNTVDIPDSDVRLTLASIGLIRDYDNEKDDENYASVLVLSNFHSKYNSYHHCLTTVFPLVDLMISVEVLWTIFFVKAVLSSLKGRSNKIHIEKHISTTSKVKKPLELLVSVPLLMAKVILPSDIELALEVDSLQYSQLKHNDLKLNVARLYCQNPHAAGFWTLMVIVSHARYRFIPKHLVSEDKIETHVVCDDIRIEIPYQYVFYKSFDNFKAFFKSIKKLKLNFKDLMYIDENDKTFKVDVIPPHLIDYPFTFPTIRIKSKRIYYCNHDDPFEEELTRQLLLGQLEQKTRISKYATFLKYETKMLASLKEKYKDVLSFDGDTALMPEGFNSKPTPKVFSQVAEHSDSITKSKAKTRSRLSQMNYNAQHQAWKEYQKDYHFAIEIPKNRLLRNLSKSWISRVNTLKKNRKAEGGFKGNILVEPKVRKEFLEKYPVLVEGEFQPLFGFKVENAVLDLKEPDFGLKNYPDFMYKTARGMPKDMKYGIFVAMNLTLSCSQAAIQIKDFPLPFVGFGGAIDDGPKTVVFKGDLVICEQMNTPEEIRYNFVPCVPQYEDSRLKDSLYAFHISRTMTNIKFVTDMDIYVKSTRSACVSWSPALKSGISYAFGSFDLLSKPPLDISDKIGFWDKFPMIIPSRFRFHLSNGITLFMKSGQSPYNLIGRNAGMAFKWDNDVLVSVNRNDKPEDFLVVESKVFEIGVPVFNPNYLMSLSSDGTVKNIEFGIAKVLLRLTSAPITWKLGFVFERNKNFEKNVKPGSVERTREFIPHYEVSLRNPATFQSEEEKVGWDSYKGYRSDYMYMALSLYSRDDNKCADLPKVPLGTAFNSIYWTPTTSKYFFYWWDSFKTNSGLPIKTGNLFKNEFLSDKKSPKFGKTLFGISYTLDLSPLYLTHVYQHSALGKHGTNLAFTGLKCFVKSFTMDLHQTRREVIVLDKKRNTVSKQLKLCMDRAVVDFIDADLRILTAVFNQRSAAGMLAKELGIEQDIKEFEAESISTHTSDSMDILWYDKNDFVELETQHVTKEEPNWKVLKFASSPRFYYVKENHVPDVEFKFDIIESQTHNCQLNCRDFADAAPELILKRKHEIVDQIKFYENDLSEALNKTSNVFIEKHIAGLKADLKDLKFREEILNKLEKLFRVGIFPDHDDFQLEQTDMFGPELTQGLSRVSTTVSHAKSRISDAYNKTSNFRNRFSIYAININWTKNVKIAFMRYLENLKDRKMLSFSMSNQALRMAADLYKSLQNDTELTSDLSYLKSNPLFEFNKSKELLEDFDGILHDTSGLEESEVDDAYLIKLIMPQISVSNNRNSCVQLSSNQIVMRNVVVNGWGMNTAANELTLPVESRMGITITDAFVYVLEKENVLQNKYQLFTPKCVTWPPIIPIEMYYYPAALDECVVVQGLSCVLLHTKPNQLHLSEGPENNKISNKESIRVIAPEIIATMNSSQYATLYEVGTTILQHEETDIGLMKKMVKNFLKYSDITDYKDLYDDLRQLQNNARQLLDCRRVLINSNFYNNDSTEDIESIIVELERTLLNLNGIVDIIKRSTLKKYSKEEKISQWNFMAPAVELVLLNDDATPFVEISAIDSYYMFSKSSNNLSIHTLYIYDFAIFDKHKEAKFETVATRLYDTDEELCRIDWELDQPVGGIEVIKNRTVHFAPLKVEFDMRFSTALQNFLFPKSKILGDIDFGDYDDDDDILDDNESVTTNLSLGKSNFSLMSSSALSLTSSDKDSSKISRVFKKLLPKKSSNTIQSSIMSSSVTSTYSDNNLPALTTIAEAECHDQKSNVKLMEERSQKYFMVQNFTIDRVEISLTFKGSGKLKILNLTDFKIQTPVIQVNDRITSYEELFAIVKQVLVKYVLRHTHSLIQSKFKNHKSSKGASENPQINPLLKRKLLHFTPTRTLMDDAKFHTKNKHHRSLFGDPDLMGPDYVEPQRPHQGNNLLLPNAPESSIPDQQIYKKLDDVEEE